MQYDLLPVVAANFPGLRKKRLKLVVGPVGMWKSLAAFWRDFPKQLVGIRAFCGFPQMRHFHQASVFPGSFYPQIPLKTQNIWLLRVRDTLAATRWRVRFRSDHLYVRCGRKADRGGLWGRDRHYLFI